MYKDKQIGVVVPAYNEEGLIAQTLSTVPSFADRVYAVNDASTDRTLEIMQAIGGRNGHITVVDRKERGGIGAAVITGHKKALEDGMDVVAVMAGDGQMDPAVLPMILDPVVEGRADYSKGDRLSVRRHREGMPALREFGNTLLTYLTRIASGYWHISDPQNGYTAISSSVLLRLDLNRVQQGFYFENDLLVKLHVCDAKVTDVPHPARYGSERSKIRYLDFMVNTSWLLLKGFLWRLWIERIRRRFIKTSGVAEHA